MRRFSILVAAAIAAAAVVGFSPASRADGQASGQAACFARLKKLVGDWYAKDPSGKERLVARYRVISAGSAVEETLMPGSETMEMVSIYHMDGDSLVMTHYCAIGNQPHLKATAASTPEKIEFLCTGKGTNMKSEDDMHIHRAVFMLTAADHFSTIWAANAKGKPAGPEEKFEVHRKVQ